MIGLNALFWTFIILFAIIGALRGWSKEVLVTFSVILAMFIITLLESFVPFIRDTLAATPDKPVFWMRISILGFLVFFGYQTPNITKFATGKFVKDKLQDSLLGFFLGAVNAYFFWGSILYYLDNINYAFNFIQAPEAGPIADAVTRLLEYMPQQWLGTPTIYFAVAIAFAFVIVVFI